MYPQHKSDEALAVELAQLCRMFAEQRVMLDDTERNMAVISAEIAKRSAEKPPATV